MKVIRGINKIKRPFKRAVVTVGIFDGVHIGHQFILKKVVHRAKKIKGKSVVVTFNPHPLKILNPHTSPALLSSLNHRINLIASMGVDVCVVLNFTKQFCHLSAQNFIKNIIVKKIGTEEIFVGDNFRFGCEGKGDIRLLKEMGRNFDFKVNCVNIVKRDNRVISSTQIRQLTERGKIEEAARFLGRPVSICGTVIEGSARGRWIGYPTANINYHQEAIPPRGVYAVRVRLAERKLLGILNIGTKPTFSEKKPTIEVHIFDFKENIYGKELEINFIKKLRGERKFLSLQQLVKQIERDCLKAKKVIAL